MYVRMYKWFPFHHSLFHLSKTLDLALTTPIMKSKPPPLNLSLDEQKAIKALREAEAIVIAPAVKDHPRTYTYTYSGHLTL